MRQLDTCDFCGEHPEGVYEVVPESIAGGPQRLALCAACRNTLQSVVDPLLDGADGDSATEPSESHAGGDAGTRTDQPTDTPSDTASKQQPSTTTTPTENSSSKPDEEASADSSADEPTEEEPVPKPDGYAQVLRLLQNRDEAMPREDLHALATNAYDLDSRTFEKAVDAAVENGDVEETADGLRTL